MSGLGKRLRRMMSCEYWVIAYRKRGAGQSILQGGVQTGFHLLPQRRYITQADPFLYTCQGDTWLFYEKQNLTDMRGTLWCLNLDDPADKPRLVLNEPFHLSYPQVFSYGRDTYMIPETRNAGEVRLYRCERFPDHWVCMDRILPLSAVDTTVMPAQMVSSVSDDGDISGIFFAFTYTAGCLELYVLEVERDSFRIVRKEKIYASPPSKTLRPGGAIFVEDGRVYRPAQDCRDYYGQALIINEIERLDREGFSEREVCSLEPSRFPLRGVRAVGIHTYNCNEQYEVIDLLHREISVRTILKKVEWKIRNRLAGADCSGKTKRA